MAKSLSIPQVADSFLEGLLRGVPGGPLGFSDLLDRIDKNTSLCREKVANPNTPESVKKILTSTLNSQNFRKIRRDVQTRIDQITRLQQDDRMDDAYSILISEFQHTTDAQSKWQRFLIASLRACYDYESHRNAAKRGIELKKKIAKSSKELAKSLMEFESLNLDTTPPEFSSIRHLLLSTELTSPFAEISEKWRELKPSFVGLPFSQDQSLISETSITEAPSVADLFTDDLMRFMRPLNKLGSGYLNSANDIEQAWSIAPSLPQLLKTVELKSSNYIPSQTGMVGAAVNSRETNKRTQYIRAFGFLLAEEYDIKLTTPIKKAMASVVNVVLNDLDKDTHYDDVRAALKKIQK